MTLEDFAQLRAEYGDFELVGEVGCLGLDEKNVIFVLIFMH